jgi:transposase
MEKEIFQFALTIQGPWFIEHIEYSPEEKHLDIWVDFIQGSEFECTDCGRTTRTAYDTSGKTWRHLNFFQHKWYLHCRVLCIECEDCGIHVVNVPWAKKRLDLLFLWTA